MSTFLCPNCGRQLKVIPLAGAGGTCPVRTVQGGWERGRAFALGDAPAGAEYSREVPAADLSGVEAGVKTPLFQALLTGAAVGAVTAIITIWKDLAWPTPIVAAVISAALAWWLLLIDSRRLLKTVERVIGRDLDGDGEIGFTVELTEPLAEPHQPPRMLFAHFKGVAPLHVVKFAQAAIDGRLTPAGSGLSRTKFNRIRAVTRARGLVRWRNEEYHAQGLTVTRGGKTAFKLLIPALTE